MLSIQNSPSQINKPMTPMLSVKSKLGKDSACYISDERLEMMLMMTQGNIHDTVLMALGYIIQHLDLMARSNTALASKYNSQREYYRDLLKSYTVK